MKKTLFFLLAGVLLCACAKKASETQTYTMPETNLVVNPIMPIHYQGTKTHLVLTDYLPCLSADEDVTIATEPSYAVTNLQNGECDLEGDNTLSCLQVTWGERTVDIAVLPNLPHEQGFVTTGYDEHAIYFALPDVEAYQVRAFVGDTRIPSSCIRRSEGDEVATLVLDSLTFPAGRSFIRIYAATFGTLYNDLLIPMQDGRPATAEDLMRHDDQSQVLYSVLIDRFQNGNTANDCPLNDPEVLPICDYQGGDLAGIAQKIEDGYFSQLGITTLWISPITQNPTDAWGEYPFQALNDNTYNNKYDPAQSHTRYSGYHGYWPISSTRVDNRFGTDEELRHLLNVAHLHGMNVILDYVANHLHINSPVYAEHPDWHTDSLLPDGRRNFELWDEARLTTWFDRHIPTLDLERSEVREPMTDSALHWVENFDFDGFRHDACKHIPEAYWRTLAHKMVTRLPNRHIWMIGETYGSPELINSYVKSGMLNAQFDFNVYFTAIHALCNDGSMADVDKVIRESAATYGAHHTMGNISGNHDQVRFASLAGGAIRFDEDGKEAGWTREIGIGDADAAYRRTVLLHMLNLTIPGVPCIYQGDEYAEVGGGDPDNRKMMRFEELSEAEQHVRQQVSELIAIRRANMPLLYGEYLPVEATASRLVFRRSYMGSEIMVCIDREGPSSITKDGEILFSID